MPKRSNEFQKLVRLVKTHLADPASVEESCLLEDTVSGEKREVDVCVFGKVGGDDVTVSIECVDWRRRADRPWVEKMKAKHDRLPTDKLILYSRSGLSKSARRYAEECGIATVEFEDVDEGYIHDIIGAVNSLYVVSYSLSPTKVLFCVPAQNGLPAENVRMSQDTFVFDEEGNQFIAKDVVESFLRRRPIADALAREAMEEHACFKIADREFRDENGKCLYIEKINPHVMRPIEKLGIEGKCQFEFSDFPLQHGRLGTVSVSWGTGEIEGKPAMIVASAGAENTAKVSITVEGLGTSVDHVSAKKRG